MRIVYADLKYALDPYAARRPRKVLRPISSIMMSTDLPASDHVSVFAAVGNG